MMQEKRNKPQKPVIGVLVDESGSTSWIMRDFQNACINILEACEIANIPVAIWGHDAEFSRPNVRMHECVDFDRAKKKKANVLNLRSGQNTREGMVIKTACELLRKRKETKKILFVLSDGCPEHVGYSGNTSKADCRRVVKENNDITIIALAVGQEYVYQSLCEVYDNCIAVDSKNLGDRLSKLLIKTLQ